MGNCVIKISICIRNKTGRPAVYDDALKIAAARKYLTGNLSFSQAKDAMLQPLQNKLCLHINLWNVDVFMNLK